MDALFFLIPLALVLLALIGIALWMANRSGQFDDLVSPATAVLLDDDSVSGELKPQYSKPDSNQSEKE